MFLRSTLSPRTPCREETGVTRSALFTSSLSRPRGISFTSNVLSRTGSPFIFDRLIVLGECVVIFHQTLKQLYHVIDKDLADRAKRQDLLGFNDIQVGDEPDACLLSFIGTTLPELLPDERTRFDKQKGSLGRLRGRENPPARVRRTRTASSCWRGRS